MKAILIILAFLLSAQWTMAQLSTNQKKQVDSLIAKAVRPVAYDNAVLKVMVLQQGKTIDEQGKTIDSLKRVTNTLFFYSPLIGRDSTKNDIKVGNIIYLKTTQ